ncbi:hypothetical protein C1645_824940 [Glomus cerebriforme]|uniref:Protein kinase domain-containing protein n=1 Tax=Glomus cerebriforme TaxID=658196 RepID=A0A397ST86_9GLOM|nr:hypothetical protein C1645_824940 [Glomus cerebriforme]
MIKYTGKGGFNNVYSALWIEGPRRIWPINVALKRLDYSQNISTSLGSILAHHHPKSN